MGTVKQRININIAGKLYPLDINPDEEEFIRAAAKLINETIDLYKRNYVGWTEQELITMIALRYTKDLLKLQANTDADNLERELKRLDIKLEKYLKQD